MSSVLTKRFVAYLGRGFQPGAGVAYLADTQPGKVTVYFPTPLPTTKYEVKP